MKTRIRLESYSQVFFVNQGNATIRRMVTVSVVGSKKARAYGLAVEKNQPRQSSGPFGGNGSGNIVPINNGFCQGAFDFHPGYGLWILWNTTEQVYPGDECYVELDVELS